VKDPKFKHQDFWSCESILVLQCGAHPLISSISMADFEKAKPTLTTITKQEADAALGL
jgi:hypothetical protein